MRLDSPTIQDALQWARSELTCSDSASLDARVLLCHCLQVSAVYLHTWPEKLLDENTWQQFQDLIRKRVQGLPVAHLTGTRDFWTLSLTVNEHTLIPRPETELLVETALSLFDDTPIDALDLGTGTGAIALALASERQSWTVTGVDRIEQSVELARLNARQNNLEQVRFFASNWFDAIDQHRYSLIISNPPYVEPHSPYLTQGDVRFEPLSALTAEDLGLADLRKIISQASQYLVDSGWLLLEHGHAQGQAVRDLMQQAGFMGINTLKDLAGLDRVTLGQWPDMV
ncbi:peptide chain release factor N(5)-glutamine methyltransferase [Bowmanella sp. Y26]|uniref:peptide chain release factor N(5)-glutamine methyltransferase n=1 Tax=Bowmanella yangjiangensis TaxID=2811230 RepID=UPI001BDC400E|nr:peptide chain release factor N(5)-glutamine methyltransferase [Bowmanella yangjiangensis]MBT1065339.1 peptide chain release factor N(5)-glutamine methyltransferase [Bowmanella yangjiangensis]